MNPLANILTGEVKDIFKNLTGFVENLVVSKEDKAKIIERIGNADNEIQMRIQDNLTERHKIDMQSDSWLSKNVRPMFLVTMIVAFFLMAIFDGNLWEFDIHESYRNILLDWGGTAVMFYFGSRGIEKIVTRTPELTEKLFQRRRRKKDGDA